jgi:hypothetical protein
MKRAPRKSNLDDVRKEGLAAVKNLTKLLQSLNRLAAHEALLNVALNAFWSAGSRPVQLEWLKSPRRRAPSLAALAGDPTSPEYRQVRREAGRMGRALFALGYDDQPEKLLSDLVREFDPFLRRLYP